MVDRNKNIPLVSSLITVYNESYNPLLSATIINIAKQTYPNIELIIVDDACIDNTILIIHDILRPYKIKQIQNRLYDIKIY